ncbi:hypothetical protein BRCON_0855 [Candidatus Sumerlaea chitinivorans]|uniref:Uncharacterized protein n=1 Tax=Sumerlaea chitinivorans TaxID=2250252 RepID=A0A2Z4Y4I3_SUMC1|nr:hypothetical protein BRCON_0855 [Candidatus Sumerlaea chitinivorans]
MLKKYSCPLRKLSVVESFPDFGWWRKLYHWCCGYFPDQCNHVLLRLIVLNIRLRHTDVVREAAEHFCALSTWITRVAGPHGIFDG